MRIISHILILAFIVSIYVSYGQWQSSHYYVLSTTMERHQKWPEMLAYAAEAIKANPFDDRPMHLLSRALIGQGHLQSSIAIMKKVLRVRPYKKYLRHNLKAARTMLKKSLERKD